MPAESIYSEQELLRQIARGDQAAFRKLYEQHWNRLYFFALSWLKTNLQAEDTVQEVFLKLWINRSKLTHINSPADYLFISCRNTVINLLEKQATRHKAMNSPKAQGEEPATPDTMLQLKQLHADLWKAVDKLPSQQRQIFRMSREEGLSHEQIAEKLGIQKTTVKNHLVRALNTLRSNWDPADTLFMLCCWLIEQALKK